MKNIFKAIIVFIIVIILIVVSRFLSTQTPSGKQNIIIAPSPQPSTETSESKIPTNVQEAEEKLDTPEELLERLNSDSDIDYALQIDSIESEILE
jgi:Na+-transporting methylmalonyl-CoA/oxaloacetate decarboxylase gamma subunit